MPRDKQQNRYYALLEKIFFDRFRNGLTAIAWTRTDIERAAESLKIKLPKNLGDVIYSMRYRAGMPQRILEAQPKGKEWIIVGKGRASYEFRLVKLARIEPNPSLIAIKIPDATPEIINKYALSDEQALLARVRYNRLLDIFLGVTAYSMQNHLRTTVAGIGQIEIDEIYVAVDKHGRQFVIPVQAKGGSDKLSVVQAEQDLACCAEKFPGLICRAISTQFMDDDLVVLFEVALHEGQVRIVEEKHYRLVPASEISQTDLDGYGRSA